MPVWNFISGALDKIPGTSDWWANIDASSYSSTIGDQTSFVLGGSQIYNTIGSNISVTIDWEEVIAQVLSGFKPSLVDGSMFWLTARGLLLGIGGNTGFVVGNNSSFNYWGESFSVNRNRHEFTCTVPSDSHASMPRSVGITLTLGIVGLLTTAIFLRCLLAHNFNAEDATVAADSWQWELLPQLESDWLEILKLVEFCESLSFSLKTDIETAKTSLETAEKALVGITNAQTALQKAGLDLYYKDMLTANIKAEEENIAFYKNLITYGYLALMFGLNARIARQKNAQSNPQSPIVTRVTADQYTLISNSIMATTQKGPILLMAHDYKNAQDEISNGCINLNASQISFSAQGSAYITMDRQGWAGSSPPAISLMTMGETSSAIYLMAQQEAPNSPMASITARTNGIELLFGSPVPGNSFIMDLNNKGVNIKKNQDKGPQIQLGTDSIALKVGGSSLTINNDGITITANKFTVNCGNSELSMANKEFSTKVGNVINKINDKSHTLTAGETNLSVANEGITLNAAIQNVKIGANNSLQQTIEKTVADALANNQAGLQQNN